MARQFTFTEQADQDLLQIYVFTYQTWGEAQSIRYTNALKQRMQKLANTPSLGKQRDEIRPGYYSYHQGRHYIFYRVVDNGIQIARILHDQRNINQQFSEDS